jgi:Cu(I)/Ag(I) efflux system periplasmic protein CusF
MQNVLLIMLLAAFSAGNVLAHHEAISKPPGQGQPLPASPKTAKGTGVIQDINKEKGMVTIKHGPLQGIAAPAMTMSFLVKDKAMLANLHPLQKVNFELAREHGNYVITSIK